MDMKIGKLNNDSALSISISNSIDMISSICASMRNVSVC